MNIYSRLLVGLRWMNTFQVDGTETWIYESHDCAEASNKVDKAFFWTSLFISFGFWFIMMIGDLLTLRLLWVIITIN